MGSNARQLVFVYGSLKRGFGNNALLRRTASRFVDRAETKDASYRMIGLGGFPGVYKDGNSVIAGEAYSVDVIGMAALDRLESNGSLYQREKVDIRLDSGQIVQAWIYIFLHNSWRSSKHDDSAGVDFDFDPESRISYESWVGEKTFADWLR